MHFVVSWLLEVLWCLGTWDFSKAPSEPLWYILLLWDFILSGKNLLGPFGWWNLNSTKQVCYAGCPLSHRVMVFKWLKWRYYSPKLVWFIHESIETGEKRKVLFPQKTKMLPWSVITHIVSERNNTLFKSHWKNPHSHVGYSDLQAQTASLCIFWQQLPQFLTTGSFSPFSARAVYSQQCLPHVIFHKLHLNEFKRLREPFPGWIKY